jgi:hypothetical protein
MFLVDKQSRDRTAVRQRRAREARQHVILSPAS